MRDVDHALTHFATGSGVPKAAVDLNEASPGGDDWHAPLAVSRLATDVPNVKIVTGAGGCMHPMIEASRPQIELLCRRLGVRRLEVFGSAIGPGFDEESSDVDVLAEFDLDQGSYFDRYFELKEGLEEILGRPVDVISAASVRNPYFREHVFETKELLYAA